MFVAQVWKRLCYILATEFVTSELSDCLLHNPFILTTYVRNLNWFIWGAVTSMKKSLRNLQPVSWFSRHYHSLFRKPNVLLVLGHCHKTNKSSPRCYTVLINIRLMLSLHLRQGLPHSFPLPSFELRVGLSCQH